MINNNINTINTKEFQLRKGYCSLGTGEEKILIIGSCRSVPYVQYFYDWNKENNNRFTINFIDPFNFNYDLENNRVDMEEKILSLENNIDMLNMLKETDIFIHEYYNNFGMFNTNKLGEKNIYQFGLIPKIDICIPSFNDKFILVADIVAFNMEIRKKVIADYNVIGTLSKQTLEEIYKIREEQLEKFLEVCTMSSMGEFEEIFKENYKNIRYFHNSNHVSKHYTISIMLMMCEFLRISLSEEFIKDLQDSNDMYGNIYTSLTEYDEGYSWNESIIPLKDLL